METSISLLDRLRDHPDDQESWARLVELYQPWLRGQLRRQGVTDTDAADLVQDVLMFVYRELAAFQRWRTGSFRAWLRTVLSNRAKDLFRRARRQAADDGWLEQLADDRSELARSWDNEHNAYVVRRLMDLTAREFSDQDLRAFSLHVVEGRPVADVAAELGVSPNVVFLAKSRILRRCRELAGGLLE